MRRQILPRQLDDVQAAAATGRGSGGAGAPASANTGIVEYRSVNNGFLCTGDESVAAELTCQDDATSAGLFRTLGPDLLVTLLG